jgi:hypothetical protein
LKAISGWPTTLVLMVRVLNRALQAVGGGQGVQGGKQGASAVIKISCGPHFVAICLMLRPKLP